MTPNKRIVVCVNTLTSIEQPVYASHCQLWYHLGKEMPDWTFFLNAPRRTGIDRARNITARIALEHDCDYILFIDDDVVIPVDTVKALISCDADIAAGWTIIRGYPFENMFFTWTDETKENLTKTKEPFTYDDQGLILVDAVGFSCCLIKTSLLRKLEAPYFVTGPYNTEDIYFCIKARKADPDCRIVVHPLVKTAHCVGSEYVDPDTAPLWREFFEKQKALDSTQPGQILIPKEVVKPREMHEPNENDITYEQILKESVFGPSL